MVKSIRIPKRVGAVRVPKKVRRKANKAIKAAASPFVRDFATAAMAAAGRARRERRSGPEQEEHSMCEGIRMDIDGNKLAEAFRRAAAEGLRTFLKGLEEGLREASGEKGEPRPRPRAKPKAKAKAKAPPKPKPKPKAKAAAKPARARAG